MSLGDCPVLSVGRAVVCTLAFVLTTIAVVLCLEFNLDWEYSLRVTTIGFVLLAMTMSFICILAFTDICKNKNHAKAKNAYNETVNSERY